MRTLKALGLSAVAALALAAFGAPAAQAVEDGVFWAENGTVKLDSHADGTQEYDTALGTLTCQKVTGHAAYNGESTEITGTGVEYSECSAHTLLGEKVVTVDEEEGCHFTFTAGTYTPDALEGKGQSHGTVHTCEITITIYDNHAAGEDRCVIHVPAQTVNVTYDNVMTVEPTNEVMAVTITANEATTEITRTDTNKLGCNNHVTEHADYTGNVWVKATNADDEYVDTTVTGASAHQIETHQKETEETEA